MSEKIPVGQMSSVISEALEHYAKVATDDMKQAVKKSAKTVKNEISKNAPKRTGEYAKSWTAQVTDENASSIHMTVHSKNRYRLAHLLENGHAKRGGGRVPAQVHIAPAEQKGIEQLETEIERSLQNG